MHIFKKFTGAARFARRAKHAIMLTTRGLGQEIQETKAMSILFFRLLARKLDLDKRSDPPSPEEVREAIEQLKDVGRFSVFATISLLPGGGFSLIGLELLARHFGIRNFTFVPSAFRKKNRKNPLPEEHEIIREIHAIEEKSSDNSKR